MMKINMMFKQKKAQFYIFVAVIFCALALTLVLSNFGTTGYKQVFETLKSNYITESSYVINGAIFSGNNVSDKLNEFSLYYINYSKTRSVNFKILYFYVDDNLITINNLLDFDINVTTPFETVYVDQSSQEIISKVDYLDVIVESQKTRIEFSNESKQLKLYFRLGVLK